MDQSPLSNLKVKEASPWIRNPLPTRKPDKFQPEASPWIQNPFLNDPGSLSGILLQHQIRVESTLEATQIPFGSHCNK